MTQQVSQQVLFAKGGAAETLMFEFRIHKSINSQFIGPIFEAVYKTFALEYIKIPTVRKTGMTWSKLLNWDGRFQTVLMHQTGSIWKLFIWKIAIRMLQQQRLLQHLHLLALRTGFAYADVGMGRRLWWREDSLITVSLEKDVSVRMLLEYVLINSRYL